MFLNLLTSFCFLFPPCSLSRLKNESFLCLSVYPFVHPSIHRSYLLSQSAFWNTVVQVKVIFLFKDMLSVTTNIYNWLMYILKCSVVAFTTHYTVNDMYNIEENLLFLVSLFFRLQQLMKRNDFICYWSMLICIYIGQKNMSGKFSTTCASFILLKIVGDSCKRENWSPDPEKKTWSWARRWRKVCKEITRKCENFSSRHRKGRKGNIYLPFLMHL